MEKPKLLPPSNSPARNSSARIIYAKIISGDGTISDKNKKPDLAEKFLRKIRFIPLRRFISRFSESLREANKRIINIKNINKLRVRVGQNFWNYFKKTLSEEFKQNWIREKGINPKDKGFKEDKEYKAKLKEYLNQKFKTRENFIKGGKYNQIITLLTYILVEQRVERLNGLFKATRILTNYQGKRLPDTTYNELNKRFKQEISEKFIENYLKNYFLELDEKYNAEFREIDPKNPEKEGDSRNIGEEETFHNFYKSAKSIIKKIEGGENLEDVRDITRTTILLDDILKPVPENETKEEKEEIIQENENALADYLVFAMRELTANGFTVLQMKPKIMISGYSDLTLLVQDENGFKHEIQLQTQNTENIKHGINPDGSAMKVNDTTLYEERKNLVVKFQKLLAEDNIFQSLIQQGDEKISEFLSFLGEKPDPESVEKFKQGIDQDLAMKILYLISYTVELSQVGGVYTYQWIAEEDNTNLILLKKFRSFLNLDSINPNTIQTLRRIAFNFRLSADQARELYEGHQVISGKPSIERIENKVLEKLENIQVLERLENIKDEKNIIQNLITAFRGSEEQPSIWQPKVFTDPSEVLKSA